MVKLLLSSGLIVLIAAAAIGIKKNIRSADEVFQASTVIQTVQDVNTSSTNLNNTIVRPPTAQTVVLKEHDLSGNRQVFITGVIDENNSPEIAKQLLDLGKDAKPITIVINSPGGSVLDGAEIISAMQAAKGPVDTLCVQICASMAAMIHQFGTHRLMIDRSLVMFHPATGGVQGEVDKSYSRLGALKDYIGEMELNVARRSNMSYNDYKFKSGVEWWVSAQNAIKTNVADNIVYVRGSNGAKLYQNIASMRNKTVVPFTMYQNTGKFYWISETAYNYLYGVKSVGLLQENVK